MFSLRKSTLFIIVFTLTLSACGVIGTSSASVEGVVKRNGEPLSNNEVTLVMTVNGKDEDSQKVQTDSSGQYVFNKVKPGKYYLLFGVVTDNSRGCSTRTSGFTVLVANIVDENGEPGSITVAGNDASPFTVEADQQVLKNFEFLCK